MKLIYYLENIFQKKENNMSRFKIIAAALFSAWELGKRAWELGGKVLGQGGTFEFLEDDKAKYPSSSLKSSEERKKEYTKNLQTEKIRREKAYQKAITDLLPTLGKDTEQSIKDMTPDAISEYIKETIKETMKDGDFNIYYTISILVNKHWRKTP